MKPTIDGIPVGKIEIITEDGEALTKEKIISYFKENGLYARSFAGAMVREAYKQELIEMGFEKEYTKLVKHYEKGNK